PSSLSSEPPYDSSSVLKPTTSPSYCAPVNAITCGLPAAASESAMTSISSHVCGGSGTKSVRYHRSCTFVFAATAKTVSCHVMVASGPGSMSSTAAMLSAPVHGRIQPASANSAIQVTSSP